MLHAPIIKIEPSDDVEVNQAFKDGIYTLTLKDRKTGLTVTGSGPRRGTLKDQLITQLRGSAVMRQEEIIEAIKILARHHMKDQGELGEKAKMVLLYFINKAIDER